MLLNRAPPIAGADMRAPLRLLGRFGKLCTGGCNNVCIAHRLRQTPVIDGIIKNPFKIALRPWAKPVFSHVVRPCAA